MQPKFNFTAEQLINSEFHGIPAGIDLEAFLRATSREIWLKPIRFRKLEAVLAYLVRKHLFNGDEKRMDFINIHSNKLIQLCGDKHYKEVLQILQEAKLIEVNDRYSNQLGASFSKSYRIHRNLDINDVYIASHPRQPSEPLPAPVFANEVEEVLYKNYLRLSLDLDLFNAVISVLDESRRFRALRCASSFLNGDFKIKTGTSQRRVYHLLNTCPKEIRVAFLLDGKAMQEADIETAQPTLLSKFVKDTNEWSQYVDFLTNKDIYADMVPDAPREDVKKQFGQFCFGEYNRKNDFGEAMTTRFPEISQRIRGLSKGLACDLQDLESECNNYVSMMNLHRNGVPVITIHDGTLHLPETAQQVSGEMVGAWELQLGFRPKLKIK